MAAGRVIISIMYCTLTMLNDAHQRSNSRQYRLHPTVLECDCIYHYLLFTSLSWLQENDGYDSVKMGDRVNQRLDDMILVRWQQNANQVETALKIGVPRYGIDPSKFRELQKVVDVQRLEGEAAEFYQSLAVKERRSVLHLFLIEWCFQYLCVLKYNL